MALVTLFNQYETPVSGTAAGSQDDQSGNVVGMVSGGPPPSPGTNGANLSDVAANAEANALAALMNGGFLHLYAGAQPVNANTSLAGNTLLATLSFGNPAFGLAVSSVITANAIGSASAVASGGATFARIYKSDNGTVIMDIRVGTSGAALTLNTTSIIIGALVSVTSFIYTVTET